MSTCPHCDEPAPPAASWCEACGSDLHATPTQARPALPCVSCAAPSSSISVDGWCEQCGQRQPLPRDHYVRDEGIVAGASDKGRIHHRNEDALAVAVADDAALIVVCDGVSSTDRPDEASQAAADAAATVLSLQPNEQGIVQAAAAAQQAVIKVSGDAGASDPPSCTFVAAIARESADGVDVTVGWIGDSRAYWINAANPTASQLLTTDHSWAEAHRAIGELTDEQIEADPRAHSITRWIGVDSDDVVPELRTFSFPHDGGQLVVCSDGLWNYAPSSAELAAQVAAAAGTLAEVADALVTFANESGGHDNITVALTEATTLGASA